MHARRAFPKDYLRKLKALEPAYLAHDDPIRRSGFSGGPARWRAEREPILDAVHSNGDFIDIGCANGFLLECLVAWARERGIELVPHGLDLGERLIELARKRLPEFASNFHVGNAWDWAPPMRYDFVYTLCDCVPDELLPEYVEKLMSDVASPGGRLILGSYGSRSRALRALNVSRSLKSMGLNVAGAARGGTPPVTAFAWVDV
jgi:SAM-dependent methyltransferase